MSLNRPRPIARFAMLPAPASKLAMESWTCLTARRTSPPDHGISTMPPFAEVAGALAALKGMGFKLCIISNTDDDIIAGNVAQMGGTIDRVITAEQAQSYKPSAQIFEHAHAALGVTSGYVVHICASPHLDLAAARDMGFRCIWINRGTGRTPLADYTPTPSSRRLDKVPELFTPDWPG